MKSQVLMSSGTEPGLLGLLDSYYPGQGTRLVGDNWPKGVEGHHGRFKALQAVKKGKKHIRFQIVRVSV